MTAITRRTFIAAAGAAALAAACSDDGASDAAPDATSTSTSPAPSSTTATDSTTTTTAASVPDPAAAEPTALTVADFAGLGTCVLLPAAGAGPFGLEEQFVRRDITEGYPGHALRLGIRVLDADCLAVPGAAVEIWHTDASGDYSAFEDNGNGKDEAAGTTFLRGTQIADEDGIVEFHTIYPGWYPGRTVHIHVRVRVDESLVLTSQLYLDDAYTAQVFTEPAYADNGQPDTTNATDGLAGDVATDATLVALTAEGDGTLGLINVAVAV